MLHIVLFADPQTGAWNYSVLNGDETINASGAEEGYDTYETVLAEVTRAFPGALIAVPPASTAVADTVLVAAADVPGVSG